MESLDDLAAQLQSQDEWDDERAVVDAVGAELQTGHPSLLAHAAGEWKDSYLLLAFTHEDGTVLNVTHGDGYTAIVGGGVDYHGYLDTSSLIEVLIGALRGRTTYVRHSRFGWRVADYFEVAGRGGRRLGSSRRGLSAVAFLLRSIPGVPESVGRVRIDFGDTPAMR